MSDSVITLTTDFGTASPFVAAMKGVILSINPDARLIDLSHDVPPYDVRHAAFFLAEALPLFPPETLHVVVIDPEVGSSRAALFVRAAGQRLLAPDNGVWTLLSPIEKVVSLTETKYFRPTVSATFHGRDVFAPAAAHLSLGVDPGRFGPLVTSWRTLDWPAPRPRPDGADGEVVFVDHFGNLIANLTAPAGAVSLAGAQPRRVRTYHDAPKGTLVALISSSGLLEVAEVQGNAARRLGLGVGARVSVEW